MASWAPVSPRCRSVDQHVTGALAHERQPAARPQGQLLIRELFTSRAAFAQFRGVEWPDARAAIQNEVPGTGPRGSDRSGAGTSRGPPDLWWRPRRPCRRAFPAGRGGGCSRNGQQPALCAEPTRDSCGPTCRGKAAPPRARLAWLSSGRHSSPTGSPAGRHVVLTAPVTLRYCPVSPSVGLSTAR